MSSPFPILPPPDLGTLSQEPVTVRDVGSLYPLASHVSAAGLPMPSSRPDNEPVTICQFEMGTQRPPVLPPPDFV